MKKIFLILFLCFFCQQANASTKVTALTADTTPSSDDLTYTVNDPSGTPASRKVTLGNMKVGPLFVATDDSTLVNDGTQFIAKVLPSCSDSSGNHLNYNTSTNAFSCGTSSTATSDTGWTDNGTTVYLRTTTDTVTIGATNGTGALDVRNDEVRIWTGAGTNTNATAAGELYVEGDAEVDGTVYVGNGVSSTCTDGNCRISLGQNISRTPAVDSNEIYTENRDYTSFSVANVLRYSKLGSEKDVITSNEFKFTDGNTTCGLNQENQLCIQSTNDSVFIYDYTTAKQVMVGQKDHYLQFPVPSPQTFPYNALRSSSSDSVWSNETQYTFVITEIKAFADTNGINTSLYESFNNTSLSSTNDTLINNVNPTTAGVGTYYTDITSISGPNIESGHHIIWEYVSGTADTLKYVIKGYYDTAGY